MFNNTVYQQVKVYNDANFDKAYPLFNAKKKLGQQARSLDIRDCTPKDFPTFSLPNLLTFSKINMFKLGR